MAVSKTIFNLTEEKTSKLAVLIDADNASAKDIENILNELTKYGEATVKRIYGNFVNQNGSWKQAINNLAIKPMQQFAYTTGKNATDGFMIIDAMDLLYSDKVDGFCIVSSDSDFTRLAIRLRESGMKVIGIGEKKTPNAFIVACDRFVFIEVLEGATKKKKPKATTTTTPSDTKKVVEKETAIKIDNPTIDLIEDAIDAISDDDGWAFLGDVGNLIVKNKPEFDPRSYGFSKLTPMLKSLTDILEIDERDSDKKGIKHVYVRLRY